MAVASLMRGERWTIPTEADTWIAFVYLTFFVTVVAFMLYMFVLGSWTASGTSYGFVLITLVTIVVAATIAGESITPGFLVGAALVLTGVYVGALMPAKEKQEELWECQGEAGEVRPRCV